MVEQPHICGSGYRAQERDRLGNRSGRVASGDRPEDCHPAPGDVPGQTLPTTKGVDALQARGEVAGHVQAGAPTAVAGAARISSRGVLIMAKREYRVRGKTSVKVTDYQRSKVYKAEDAAFAAHTPTLDWGGCAALFDMVLACDYWQRHGGYKQVKLVKAHGGRSTWCRSGRTVRLSRHHQNPAIICHELAHALTEKTHGWETAGHGAIFCGHYLGLVRDVMGPWAELALRHCFNTHGVRYNLPG